jgi:predicted nuclease of predicted toxin-antitoxin system
LLEREFPGWRHVTACGLERADDAAIWAYAKANGLSLLSKDDDMRVLVEAHGAPPRLVWLRLGNVTTQQIAAAMTRHAQSIHAVLSGDEAVMEIL